MKIKPSCKSQFKVIADEVNTLLEQGYSKKAVYDYFTDQGKIKMCYSSWSVILNYQSENNPFSLAQKKSNPGHPLTKSKTVSVNKRGFQHDSTPYASKFDLKSQEKKELKANLISKKNM